MAVFAPNAEIDPAVNAFGDYIARQVLADKATIADLANSADIEVLDIDGLEAKVTISLSK